MVAMPDVEVVEPAVVEVLSPAEAARGEDAWPFILSRTEGRSAVFVPARPTFVRWMRWSHIPAGGDWADMPTPSACDSAPSTEVMFKSFPCAGVSTGRDV